MLKRKHVIFAGAVAAALPAVMANAATITLSFDPSDYFVSTTTNGTYLPIGSVVGASVTGGTANPTVILPAGDFLEFGLDAQVTNNGGYGITAFQTGVTNSNNAAYNAATGAVVVNPFFSSISGKGTAANGSVAASLGTAGSYIITGTTNSTAAVYGAAAPAELYKGMKVVPVAGGTTTFAITDLDAALQYTFNTGLTSSGAPIYGQQTFIPGTDTLNALPVLTVKTAGSVVTAQKIVSLTTTAPTSYGSQLGTPITITGKNGSYTTGNTGQIANPGVTSAFTMTSTFNPIDRKSVV